MTAFDLAFTQTTNSFRLTITQTWSAAVTGVFGPSGSGKSTLLEVLLGLRAPVTLRGAASVDGVVLFDRETAHNVPSHARGFGWAPQEAALFPHLTVEENVAFACQPGTGIDRGRIGPIAALCEVDTLLARRPATLSGGERQRVALARALYAARPRHLVLLDEPFASLDLKRRRRLLAALKEHGRAEGLGLVYVSHEWAEIETLCEHVLLFEGGTVSQAGAPGHVTPY